LSKTGVGTSLRRLLAFLKVSLAPLIYDFALQTQNQREIAGGSGSAEPSARASEAP